MASPIGFLVGQRDVVPSREQALRARAFADEVAHWTRAVLERGLSFDSLDSAVRPAVLAEVERQTLAAIRAG